MEWTGSAVDAGDVTLRVFSAGAGPVVVMVHGWPDTHRVWTGTAALLAQRYRVVAYDTRGMGESTHPGSDDGFGLARLARDLRAVIEAVSPEQPVHLVAHDWGSIQCWEAVCEPWAPERIASFTSISGPSLDHVGHWLRRSLLAPTPARMSGVLRQAASSSYIPVFLSPVAPLLLRRVFGTKDRWARLLQRIEGIAPPDRAPSNRAPSDRAPSDWAPSDWAPSDRHHGQTLPDDMVSGLAYYRANAGRVIRPRSRRAKVPVLLLVPEQDRAVRGASYDEAKRWVEELVRHDVPYGHWVMLARPDLVASEVTAFIEAHPTPSG